MHHRSSKINEMSWLSWSFGQVTKLFLDLKILVITIYIPVTDYFLNKLKKQLPDENFAVVMLTSAAWQKHIFVRCVTGHGAWWID